MADTSLNTWRATLKRRLTVSAVLFGLWAAVIEGRLFYFQVVKRAELTREAERRHESWRPIPASRGDILDRSGQVLASSVNAPTISADPSQIEDVEATIAALCGALSNCRRDRDIWRKRLSDSDKRYAPVRRQATEAEAARLAALALPGIVVRREPRRYYPNRDSAAHVLGFVDANQHGRAGIEQVYDRLIRGQDGRTLVLRDGGRTTFSSTIERLPTTGSTIELTIDEYLQYVVERELLKGVRENRAQGGSVVVLDPATGETLAMASYPTFNPNAPGEFSAEAWRNRAAQVVYEPGSTFKIITASAALERGVTTPSARIDVAGGRIGFGAGDYVYDTHPHQVLSFADVFAKSSNVGAIKVALELGAGPLIDYARRFGFGRRTSDREFPAEAVGRVWPAHELRDRDLARVAIGYQISVTPLQMAAAVSSIANGGELIKPSIVRAIVTNGVRMPQPKVVMHRTVTPAVAAQVTALMEGVVDHGTGTQAQISGYTVAGKTGTARKWVDGGYSSTEYNASFVGFVPSRKPAYTIVVVIDSPDPTGRNGVYGGPVAAPIFRRIAEAALRHGAVPPTLNAPPPILVQRERAAPGTQRASADARPAALQPARLDRVAAAGRYPDLTGMSAREAAIALARLGVQATIHGSGFVIEQRPHAGAAVESGLKAVLWLARRPPDFQRASLSGP